METKLSKQNILVENFLIENGLYNAPLEWFTNNIFVDEYGCNGYVFKSEDDAINSILNGDNFQNAIDYVKGAQTPQEWINYLISSGVNKDNAYSMIINQDWVKVIETIIDNVGPEWFLSSYSGNVYNLTNGYLLYY